jgi:hypothetical protein
VGITCAYEIWRPEDVATAENGRIVFYHRNSGGPTMLDKRLAEQGITHLKPLFTDVERNRQSGGALVADGFVPAGNGCGRYIFHDFTATKLQTAAPVKSAAVTVYLHTAQTEGARKEIHIFPHRGVLWRGKGIRHPAYAPTLRKRVGGNIHTIVADTAGILHIQPGQNSHGCSLARAIGANQAHRLSTLQFK